MIETSVIVQPQQVQPQQEDAVEPPAKPRKKPAGRTINDMITRAIERAGHSVDEILWVGSHDGGYGQSWAEFSAGLGRAMATRLASYSWYRRIYRGLPNDLVVVGDGWWLRTFNGNAFRFTTPPQYGGTDTKPLRAVMSYASRTTVAQAHAQLDKRLTAKEKRDAAAQLKAARRRARRGRVVRWGVRRRRRR